MFLCDITQHFNELNKKLQGNGQIVLMMFENIRIFMTKLDIFTKDLEMKIMKYFPQLQKHFRNTIIIENTLDVQENAIKKYLMIIQEIKQAFEERFNQLSKFGKYISLYFISIQNEIRNNGVNRIYVTRYP